LPTTVRPPPPQPHPAAVAKALGIVTLATGGLLLLGAVAKAGTVLGLGSVWGAWGSAPGAVRFSVFLVVLVGVLGAGPTALTMTWKREHRLNLLGAFGLLIAGSALLLASSYNPQYGASAAMPLIFGLVLAAGFLGSLRSAWKRYADKGDKAELPAEPR